jgi:hypothetical protein
MVVLLSWVVLHVPFKLFDLVLKHNQHFINIKDYNIKTIVTGPSLATKQLSYPKLLLNRVDQGNMGETPSHVLKKVFSHQFNA